MQRELASVDEDANLPNYGRSRQFLNQDSSRERSVKLRQKKNPVCQNENSFDRSLGQIKQQSPQILPGGSRDVHPPRQTQEGSQKQNGSSKTSNLTQKKPFEETRRDRSSSDRSRSREKEQLSRTPLQSKRSEAPSAERQATEVQRTNVHQKISPSKGIFQPREQINQNLTKISVP